MDPLEQEEARLRALAPARDEEGEAESHPGGAADLARDVARECVDAGAKHVADDDEEEQSGADGAAECRRLRFRLVRRHAEKLAKSAVVRDCFPARARSR